MRPHIKFWSIVFCTLKQVILKYIKTAISNILSIYISFDYRKDTFVGFDISFIIY